MYDNASLSGSPVATLNTYTVKEQIIRGGVKGIKIDHDRNKAIPQGDATLEGAEFTIYSKSKLSVMIGGAEIKRDIPVKVIKTDKEGNATTAERDLPYGAYVIKETKLSTGYLLNETWEKIFEVRERKVPQRSSRDMER